MSMRSDLAIEAAQTLIDSSDLPDGISVKKYVKGSFNITDVKISSDAGSEKIGKPKGRFLTLESSQSLDMSVGSFEKDCLALSGELSSLLGHPSSVLAIGLGNFDITPDSLGSRVADRIIATRHIKENCPELNKLFETQVSVLKTGVMGKTGIESSELIKSAVEKIKPDCLIVCDALACSGVSRLGSAVQLTDTGISPGSGVMNSRKEISKNTVGIPCVAIGVPTIADSKELGMMVTPKNIDRIILRATRLISNAVNLCLHPELSLSELEVLSE